MFQVILLSFREFVLLENSFECKSAVLRYYDGDNMGRNALEFCGSELPNVTRSSSNVIVFELHFPTQYGWSGFRIDYAAVDRSSESRYPVMGTGNINP